MGFPQAHSLPLPPAEGQGGGMGGKRAPGVREGQGPAYQRGVGGQLFTGSSSFFGHFSVVLSLLFQPIPKQVVCRDFASPLLNSHH